MSKEMNNTNSVEETKNLTGKNVELDDAALDSVNGGIRMVPTYVDDDIRGRGRRPQHNDK